MYIYPETALETCFVVGETGATSNAASLSISDNDHSGNDDTCYSEDEQHCSSTRKNIPWDGRGAAR